MNIQHHTKPENLEKYSFLWSEARLVLAALALFRGGVPLVSPYGLSGSILTVFWIISGLAAGYMLYEWNKHKTVFGGKEKLDTYAFFVMVVSGINLGLTGLLGRNIGMSIVYNQFVFFLVAILYLITAYHLYHRWKAHGQKLF